MPTARAVFQAHVDGLLSGDFPVKVAWALSTGVGQRQVLALVQGDNTLDVPDGTTLIVLVPPATNALGLLLKGDAGDVGKTLAANRANIVSHGGDVTIVNAEDDIDGVEVVYL